MNSEIIISRSNYFVYFDTIYNGKLLMRDMPNDKIADEKQQETKESNTKTVQKNNSQSSATEQQSVSKNVEDKKQPSDVTAGAELLFKNVKEGQLATADKQSMFSSLGFSLSEDKTKIMDDKLPLLGQEVELVDMNGDGKKEVIITWSVDAGYPQTTIFSKIGNADYRKILEVAGALSEAVTDVNNGFPDLIIVSRGMSIPVWRYNGYMYKFSRQVSDTKKLKTTSLADFEKNRVKYMAGKDASGAPALSSLKMVPPTAATRGLIFNRWKTSDVIGSNRESFLQMKERKETTEMQFTKDGKCYMYKNGLLEFEFSCTVAPDGKSILLSTPNQRERLTLQILSVKSNELMMKMPHLYEQDVVILKAN